MLNTRHLLIALVLHAVLLGLLILRFDAGRQPVIVPDIVQGVLLETPREDLRKQQETERKRLEAEAEKQRRAEEQKRKAEAERKAHEQEKREAERRERENQQRIAEEVERRKQAEAEARRKAEEEKQRKADEARRQAEAERKRKIEEQRRQAEEAQREREAEDRAARERHRQELQAAMQAEEKARQQAAQAARNAEDTAVWIGLIQDAVQRNWVRPAGLDKNFSCVVEVEKLPGGQIVSVDVVESCGSPLLDNSVVNAVRKSDPLPIAPNPSVDVREIRFTFKPEQ